MLDRKSPFAKGKFYLDFSFDVDGLLSDFLLSDAFPLDSLPPDSLLLDPLSPNLSDDSFLLPPLKSVSYQPEPLSLNDEADTSLVNEDLSHSGQSLSGSSFIFCSFSNR